MTQESWWTEEARAAIGEAVKAAGSQSALARLLQPAHPTVSQQRVHQWLQRGYATADDGICITIERATGVARERLRGDVYRDSPETGAETGHRNQKGLAR